MKPFLGIDITHDKKNEEENGKEFRITETSPAMVEAFENSGSKAMEMINAAKLPLPLRIIKDICGIGAMLIAFAIIRAFVGDDIGIAEAYGNAPVLFWVMGIAAILWLILKLLGDKKENAVAESEDVARLNSRINGVMDSIFAELDVPEYAYEVDVLSFAYKLKDGVPKVTDDGSGFAPYVNDAYKFFVDSENMYLADVYGKYAIPLDSLRTIREVSKKIRLLTWNKDEAPTEGAYKQYKLKTDEYDCVSVKPYYILEFEREGELWGIYFPCYELPAFTELTGLPVEQA